MQTPGLGDVLEVPTEVSEQAQLVAADQQDVVEAVPVRVPHGQARAGQVRRALAVTLDVADGLIAPSQMTDQITRTLGNAPRIVAFAAEARPEEFAAKAPIITDCAKSGDPLAREILETGAAYLAKTLELLGWKDSMALCLTGGIGGFYADHLPLQMRGALTAPTGTPLDGAVLLASSLAQEVAQ